MNPMLKSWLKVFAATILAMFIADGADIFGVSTDDLRGYIAAGLGAVLPIVVTWLDPSDPRWGRQS